jgi:outer membrane protein assembly factor BamA
MNLLPLFGLLSMNMLLAPASVAGGTMTLAVRSVTFDGNRAFSANQLTAVLVTEKGKQLSEAFLSADLGRLLEFYASRSFLHTQIDSIQIRRDTIQEEADVRFFLHEGKPSVVRRIEYDGCQSLTSSNLSTTMRLQVGDLFTPVLLEQDIQAILKHYELRGYPLAKAEIQNISFADSVGEMSVAIHIHIDEGNVLRIVEMSVEGNRTTKEYVLMREARLKENDFFTGDLPERIKRRIDHLQLFSSVALPELYLTDSQQGGLLLKVVEGNQNSFDGVLGYVPSARSGESGSVTGLVNVSLRNLFGTGRKLSARWYQENKTSQETELHYFEPWVASYPVNLQGGFLQRKQDSTFVRMQYDLAAEVMLTEEFTLGATFSQSGVYPTEGYGRAVMAESKSTGFGASIRYDSRDNPTTPTQGVLYSTEYITGSKQTTISGSFPTESRSTTQRLVFDLSFYFSPFLHQVLASELHIRDFSSSVLDMSDMFRLGGASTLRGYREGQFLGSRLVWMNLEYRSLLAPRSYFYGFMDIGYIVQPGIVTLGMTAAEQSKIGYGIGVRMDSALGLMGVSFAFGEGDTFSTSKIHIRLINEF